MMAGPGILTGGAESGVREGAGAETNPLQGRKVILIGDVGFRNVSVQICHSYRHNRQFLDGNVVEHGWDCQESGASNGKGTMA